jgi:putative transposase
MFSRPEAITTDGLRSYGAAMNALGNREKREVGRWANNRVESSHVPFRRRERAMARFRRMSSLQKFASVHANLHNHFSLERHSRRPPDLQGTMLCRLGRVAARCELGPRP